MFRGKHEVKVDDTGRLKLPSAFAKLAAEAKFKEFYITSADGKSAEIWPLQFWEKREQVLLDEASEMNEVVRKYLAVTSGYGHQVEIDSQNRLMLPPQLRTSAKLDGEVALSGKVTYIEVENREVFEANFKANELTKEDRQSVDGLLHRRERKQNLQGTV